MSEIPTYGGKRILDYTRSFTRDRYARRHEDPRPNIVLLFTDEQRADTIGALGAEWMQTPNLDRLAAEGTAFVNAHTPNPVCVPARHNVVTGLPARYHGMADNQSAVIHRSIPRLPQLLADAGYHCGEVGKMHFQPPRTHHGFHRMQLMEEIPVSPADDEYLQYLRANGLENIRNTHGVRNLLYWQPQRSLVPEEHHGTSWVGDRSAEFIRDNAWRPFFLWAGWIAPHPPLNCPDRWAELYTGADLPEPTPPRENPNARLAHAMGQLDDPSPQKVRRLRELYYGAVSHVDHNVGKILQALEETHQAENTLVIFTSDHGEMLGDLGSWSKSQPTDASCRIPMICRYPGHFDPGDRRHEFADLNDLLPTILHAAGVDYPEDADIELPGESLLLPPGGEHKDRSVQYVENCAGRKRFVMLRDERYKFVHWYDGREEFFDLREDPDELVDLLAGTLSPEQRSAADRLRAQLLEYETRWGLPGCVVDGEFRTFEPTDPWLPGAPSLSWQFQNFPHGLSETDKARLDSEREEVLRATAKEPTVDLSRLNLGFYLSAGGDPSLVEEVRKGEETQ